MLIIPLKIYVSAIKSRNIILIMADDLRPAMGCYHDKNAITPNIDKLAATSFLFNHAYAQVNYN